MHVRYLCFCNYMTVNRNAGDLIRFIQDPRDYYANWTTEQLRLSYIQSLIKEISQTKNRSMFYDGTIGNPSITNDEKKTFTAK